MKEEDLAERQIMDSKKSQRYAPKRSARYIFIPDYRTFTMAKRKKEYLQTSDILVAYSFPFRLLVGN